MAIGKRRDRWVALALVLACGGVAHAQDAALAKNAELLADPEPGATVIAKLKAAAPLTVLDRKGGWYRVRGPGGEEGWVKLLAVRLTTPAGTPQEGQGGESAGAASAALGGASSGGLGGAAAGALGSMVTGSSADSTAVRGGASGKLSGKTLVDPANAEAGAESSLEEMDSFEPSEDDMKAFEEGLDSSAGQPKQKTGPVENPR